MLKNFVLLSSLTLLMQPAWAQSQLQSGGTSGTYGNTSNATLNMGGLTSALTGHQNSAILPTTFGGLAPFIPSGGPGPSINGLPATSTDNFVEQAGGEAELIYGDEGVDSIPPYNEFDTSHRIQRGIFGARDAGLTTGHGSYLPDAWGGDEFVKGPEFAQSGPTFSNSSNTAVQAALQSVQAAEQAVQQTSALSTGF